MYEIKCTHANNGYSLLCKIHYIEDNVALNATFPDPLRNLTQYMTHLILDVSNITALPSDIFEMFPNVQSLIAHVDLQTLERKQFQNAKKLKVLNLGFNNQLGTLEPNVFTDVPTLEYLDLAFNYIDVVEEKAFIGLKRLKYLYFGGNLIDSLKNDTFRAVPNIELLDLSKNQISEVESRAFSMLKKLQRLHISQNQISRLPRGVFNDLKSIVQIDLSQNAIETIEEGAFSGLTTLRTLEIGFNRIWSMSDTIFADLKNLEGLFLALNSITTIGDRLQHLHKLRNLDLSYNQIFMLEPEVLAHQTKLESLELRSINLTTVEPELFENKTNLILLDLSQNNLTEIDVEMFEPLPELRVLKLELTSIIDLNYKKLKGILPKLEFVNLAGNELDCDLVVEMVRYFGNNSIEYEFGEPLDVSCELLPFQSQALQAYKLSKAELFDSRF